jgi:hypothetical protein
MGKLNHNLQVSLSKRPALTRYMYFSTGHGWVLFVKFGFTILSDIRNYFNLFRNKIPVCLSINSVHVVKKDNLIFDY